MKEEKKKALNDMIELIIERVIHTYIHAHITISYPDVLLTLQEN